MSEVCPRCKQRPPMHREASAFHAYAVKLAKKMGAQLPPAVCEECLRDWRASVDEKMQESYREETEKAKQRPKPKGQI